MTVQLKGTAASDGIAIGKTYLLVEPDLSFEKKTVQDVGIEKSRFHEALIKTIKDVDAIRLHAADKMGEEEAKIFDAHKMILSDPELIQAVETAIMEEKQNAESALWSATEVFIQIFENMEENEYMKERAADIRDIRKRVLSYILGVTYPDPASIQEEVILIANDLSPSDTAQLNKSFIQAFVTEKGGSTSHSAIMARSLEIPAVVGVKEALEHLPSNTMVVVDGTTGMVVLNPSDEEVKEYRIKQKRLIEEKKEWQSLLNEPSLTKDGKQVELAANIGSLKDLTSVEENGAEGIGLFRTEFLYMESSSLPSEESQFLVYKEVLARSQGKNVVVRTMDIGGDKKLPYLNIPEEMNPFLGYRAIRMCLEEDEIFRTQLRALLRASVYGKLSIMFPMIATLEELREAKEILQEEKEKLVNENQKVSDFIQIGIMVETPATAVLADQFAKEVDFFSIGTNDLIQYTMAADRMNEKVSYLYQPLHPALLRLIKHVIDSAHKEGKWAGMCGEVAGDPLSVPLLLGLGLDEFSMSATSILKIRHLLKTLDSKQMELLAQKAVTECGTHEEVKKLVEETVNKR